MVNLGNLSVKHKVSHELGSFTNRAAQPALPVQHWVQDLRFWAGFGFCAVSVHFLCNGWRLLTRRNPALKTCTQMPILQRVVMLLPRPADRSEDLEHSIQRDKCARLGGQPSSPVPIPSKRLTKVGVRWAKHQEPAVRGRLSGNESRPLIKRSWLLQGKAD